MKRSLSLIILFIAAFVLFPSNAVSAFAAPVAESAVVIFDEWHENDRIVVTATLQRNPGISDATFQLQYDNTALALTEYEQGEALKTLDLTPSKTVETYPFVFLFGAIGSSKTDETTGVLFTLSFKVKDTAKDGEYTIGVKSTVINWVDGNEQDVKVISDKVKIEVVNKQVEGAVIELDRGAGSDTSRDTKTLITLVVSAVVAGALLISLIILIIIRYKRSKGAKAWIKL